MLFFKLISLFYDYNNEKTTTSNRKRNILQNYRMSFTKTALAKIPNRCGIQILYFSFKLLYFYIILVSSLMGAKWYISLCAYPFFLFLAIMYARACVHVDRVHMCSQPLVWQKKTLRKYENVARNRDLKTKGFGLYSLLPTSIIITH